MVQVYCGKVLELNQHILYINGEYRGNDEIGRLMHDFNCSDPHEMINEDVKDRSNLYKNTDKGIEEMSDLLKSYIEKENKRVAKEVTKRVTKKVTKEVTKKVSEETSVKTSIENYREFNLSNQEIINRLLAKYTFLTKEQAEKLVLH